MAVVVELTPTELIVKFAVVAPAGIVAVAGTAAALALLEESDTANPPVGAGPLIVTVPVAFVPDITDPGAIDSALRIGGETKSVAVLVAELSVAVITAVAVDNTGDVVTVTVAEVDPPGTVTDAGTVAAAVLLELKATASPPVGAGLLIATVAVEETPPTTVVGDKVTPVSVGAVTVRVFVAE